MEYRKKFISLDLETTHLSTDEGRIMEVGAVEVDFFWDAKEEKIKAEFGREFQSLVNPEIEIPPLALMLTGIRKEELQAALLWRDVKEKFRDFLDASTLLGHNIGFDLEFLKAQGLNLGNPATDTLELVQTFLPMELSHSLEYLGQSSPDPLEGQSRLGARQAHRALFDSQNAALVLAEILNRFLAFPEPLRGEIRSYLKEGELSFAPIFLELP